VAFSQLTAQLLEEMGKKPTKARAPSGHKPISVKKLKEKTHLTFVEVVVVRGGENLCDGARRLRFSTALATAVVGWITVWSPAPGYAADPTHAPVEHRRRGGFSFGIALGPALGVATGYPNDARKIDRSEFFTSTGFAGGGAGTAWLGLAFTDWLSFGIAGYGGMLVGRDVRAQSAAFAFRVEGFPAWLLGGAGRELGVSLEAGVGVVNGAPKGGGDDVIASGGASRFGFGLFYEGIRAWKFSMGPFASVDVIWSSSALRPIAWLGWRTAFYLRP
jgi:hypothetical protein